MASSLIESGARSRESREAGRVKGRFRATGSRPKFYARLQQCGIVLPTQMFQTVVEIN